MSVLAWTRSNCDKCHWPCVTWGHAHLQTWQGDLSRTLVQLVWYIRYYINIFVSYGEIYVNQEFFLTTSCCGCVFGFIPPEVKYSLCHLATTNKCDKRTHLVFFFPISVEFYYINDYLQINYGLPPQNNITNNGSDSPL